MKPTLIPALLLLLSSLAEAQTPALPSEAGTLVNQFEAFQTRTQKEAEDKITQGRVVLFEKLTEAEHRAAITGHTADAAAINAFLVSVHAAQVEAAAPPVNRYEDKLRASAGYYNNDTNVTLKVDVVAKKRVLQITGNQDTTKTTGDVILIRSGSPTELRVGSWRKGMQNPLSFDVSGTVIKPGEYTVKLHYTGGGDMFRTECVAIETTK